MLYSYREVAVAAASTWLDWTSRICSLTKETVHISDGLQSDKPKRCREFQTGSFQNLSLFHWTLPRPTTNISHPIHPRTSFAFSTAHPHWRFPVDILSAGMLLFPFCFFPLSPHVPKQNKHRGQNRTLEKSGTKFLFTWHNEQAKRVLRKSSCEI